MIAEVAREHGCRLIQLGEDFDFDTHSEQQDRHGYGDKESTAISLSRHSSTSLTSFPARNSNSHQLPLAMRGPHQAANAAVALATIAELRHQGWCVSTTRCDWACRGPRLPAASKLIAGEPTVVLDTAHNPASARALVETLAEMPPPSRRTLVLSISHDKDVRAIVARARAALRSIHRHAVSGEPPCDCRRQLGAKLCATPWLAVRRDN